MSKILALFAASLMGFSSAAFAQRQSSFVVEGSLADSLTSFPEAYATVRVLSAGKEKPVKVVTSDADGKFRLTLPHTGDYSIQMSTVGKQTIVRNLHIVNAGTIHLGKLLFQESTTTLGTAMVMAQRPIVKAEVDKISYSMKEDPEAKTNNLLEMLRKVPMVTVDGEDKIQVNGNTSFKVYVNGKPNEMMSNNASLILKNYPASMVEKIEVITDPGAKYDAEGLAGVLNIVTKSDAKTSGYTFSPNINISNRGIKGGAFGMVQLGKLMLSAHYGVGQHSFPRTQSHTEREVYKDEINHLLTSEGYNKYKGLYQYGGLDASYEFDKHNLLTVEMGFYGNKGDRNGNVLYQMFNSEGDKTYSYNVGSSDDSKYLSLNAAVDYQHTFDKPGKMLTLSYRMNTSPQSHTGYTNYTEIESVPFELKDLYTDPDNKTIEHTAQVDFTIPFGKLHTFSTGLKYINRNNKSDNVEMNRVAGSDDAYVTDTKASLKYRHRNDIAAVYAEYGLKVSDFSARAGLRYEYSDVKVSYPDGKRDAFDSDFSDFVPTVSLGYNLTDTQLLKLGYNMRIGRPSISYLSPYVQHTTPQNITYGQPDLESEQGHNFSMGYSLFSPKFSVSATLSYALSNNGLATYSFVKDGIQHTTYANMLHSKVTNLNLFLNWMIVKGTSLNINGDVSYSDFKTYRTLDSNSGLQGGLWGGFKQELPWKLKLGLWGGCGSGRVTLQGKSSSYHFYSMNLSRSFLRNNAMTVTLNAVNIFDGHVRRTSTTSTENFRLHSVNLHQRSRFGISFSYNLGQLKQQVKKAKRTIVNSDVISGKNNGDGDMQSGDKSGGKGM